MFDPFMVATSLAISFTVGAIAIAQIGPFAERATPVLASVAIGLGMLALIGGLSQLNAEGAAVSRADPLPEFGMSWRPPATEPYDRTGSGRTER